MLYLKNCTTISCPVIISRESAQKMVEAMRVYYNTCREHSKLKVTPTEAAGLKIDLGQAKIESLIRLAARNNSNNVSN